MVYNLLYQEIVKLLRKGTRYNLQQFRRQMKRKRTFIIIFILLGTSFISFMGGRIVEATRYQYTKNECRQNLKEAKQQIAIYESELSHLRSESSTDLSTNIGTMNWTEALK